MGNDKFSKFDWYCPPCGVGYYSLEVEASDERMHPLCNKCGKRLYDPVAKYQAWEPDHASAGWRPED